MNSFLRLELFGSPRVSLDSEKLTGFVTIKSRALLFYLAMKPGVHGRQPLATLLWPEASETSAAKNLRNILSDLRKLVGTHLEITRETAAFRREAAYYLDVEQFSLLFERYRRGKKNIEDLEKATLLYSGDFLDGFHVPDSVAYEEWLASEREQLRQAQLAALTTLAAWHVEQSPGSAAMAYISRLLAFESLSETGQQLRIGLLAQTGQRREALAQYEAYCQLLDEELGITPLAETTRLHNQIKDGVFDPRAWASEIRESLFSYLQSPPVAGKAGLAKEWHAAEPQQQVDWGEIPGKAPFYGRQDQLQQLEQWVASEQSRIIVIAGLGGTGKTALAGKFFRRLVLSTPTAPLARRTAQQSLSYERLIWRSLINSPLLATVLREWLVTLSGQQLVEIPETVNEQLKLLLSYLQEQRCLLVLDNFESLLDEGGDAGSYRAGYEPYQRLIQMLAMREHRSCLLITSRELPQGFLRLARDANQVRSLSLSGLDDEPGVELLRARGLAGGESKLAELVHTYSGNPLALKLAADTVQVIFGGDIDPLLEQAAVFGDIRDVLDEQFSRLSPLEEQLLTWLAIEREPVPSETLWHDLVFRPPRHQFLDALRSLYFRSLLEQAPAPVSKQGHGGLHYTLQNVVLEYATSRLVAFAGKEIEAGALDLLQRYALLKANSKEYVQVSQRRLLLSPVAALLANRWGKPNAIARLRKLLDALRGQPSLVPGYAGANILHLLVALEEDLDSYDFSHLTIRQADLRNAPLHNVSFSGSDLSGTIFRDTFGLVLTVAFAPYGQLVAAGASDGSITFWKLHEYQPSLVIKRSTGFEHSIAFSPSGRTLAGGGSDHVIRLWDVVTGQEIHRLDTHGGEVTAVCFSPDGQTLFSSNEDRTIGVWDVSLGRLRQRISTAGDMIMALAISPDGQLLAAGGHDGTVYFWEAHSGALIRQRLEAHSNKIRALAFHPGGDLLASAGEDNTIFLWDAAGAEERGALRDHVDFVLALAFHPDGTELASGSADKTIRLWDLQQGRTRRLLHGGTNWVTSVAYSPDGTELASGGYDRAVRLWQNPSGDLLHVLQGSSRIVNEIVYSPDGRLLASASLEEPVRLWHAADGRLLQSIEGHRGSVRRLTFSPDSQTLAVSGDGQLVRLWDMQSGELRQTFDAQRRFVRTLIFSPDGRLLAAGAGTGQGTLLVWDTRTGNLALSASEIRTGLKRSFCFSPDNRFLAYSDHENAIHVVNTEDKTIWYTLAGHIAPVELLHFAPDGSLLASHDKDGRLSIWQLRADKSVGLIAKLQANSSNADHWSLVFSPDGEALALQLGERSVGVLDVRTGALRYTVVEALHSEDCLAFTLDSSALITAGVDGCIRLRNSADGEQLRKLAAHDGAVTTIAVNREDGRLASGGVDGIIHVWDVQTGSCVLTLTQPGPYAGMDITGATGLAPAQVATLQALGAVSH